MTDIEDDGLEALDITAAAAHDERPDADRTADDDGRAGAAGPAQEATAPDTTSGGAPEPDRGDAARQRSHGSSEDAPERQPHP